MEIYYSRIGFKNCLSAMIATLSENSPSPHWFSESATDLLFILILQFVAVLNPFYDDLFLIQIFSLFLIILASGKLLNNIKRKRRRID
jgi:hypothetical protein